MALPLIVGFWSAFSAIAAPIAVKALIGVGFAAVTYTGVNALWESVQADIVANLSSGASSIITLLSIARVDDALVVIMSAMSAKLVLRGLSAAGAFTKLEFRRAFGNPV